MISEEVRAALAEMDRQANEIRANIARIVSELNGADTTATGRVISIAEAGARLGKSRHTIMRMMKAGELRAFVRKGSHRASGVFEDSLAK